MTIAATDMVRTDAPIETWFGIGGSADHFARPADAGELASLVEAWSDIRVLGDGANLLVDDDGIDGLVISLDQLRNVEWPDQVDEDPVRVRVEAGANLPKFILACVRRGLGGVEGLGGIPATIGGAAVMNAGGAFGEIGSVISALDVLTGDGAIRRLGKADLSFDYRHSNLTGSIVIAAELELTPGDPVALRARLKEVMAYKKASQPMAERSAGCAFRNPTISGERVSAGRLIDQAGCKGLAVGGASVSERHANFIVTGRACRARDVIELMRRVRDRVLDFHGVRLDPEVVIWRRGGGDALA